MPIIHYAIRFRPPGDRAGHNDADGEWQNASSSPRIGPARAARRGGVFRAAAAPPANDACVNFLQDLGLTDRLPATGDEK